MTRLFGKTQIAILRTVADGRWFRAATQVRRSSCVRLLDRVLLRRDPHYTHRYTATRSGIEAIIAHDDRCTEDWNAAMPDPQYRIGHPSIVTYRQDGKEHSGPPRNGKPYLPLIQDLKAYEELSRSAWIHSVEHCGPHGRMTDNRGTS